MKTKTRPWDVVEYLKTEQDMADYLEAVFEEGEPDLIPIALGDIARAKGMLMVSRQTGMTRASLIRAFSPESKPEFQTVLKIIHALGLKLHASPM